MPANFTNPKVAVLGEIQVDEGSKFTFKPWMDRDRHSLGYTAAGGDLKLYMYLTPEVHGLEGDPPRMWLYIGPHGDPELDTRIGPYNLTEWT